jgi:hypothetical protein
MCTCTVLLSCRNTRTVYKGALTNADPAIFYVTSGLKLSPTFEALNKTRNFPEALFAFVWVPPFSSPTPPFYILLFTHTPTPRFKPLTHPPIQVTDSPFPSVTPVNFICPGSNTFHTFHEVILKYNLK